MKTISILGSGWLGLPLAKALAQQGYEVKASSRSTERFEAITSANAVPFIVDINRLDENLKTFLDTDIVIVNITSKDITAFENLISRIEASSVKKVIFTSSTSVYKNTNSIISESDGAKDSNNPLYKIEKLFCTSQFFQTTVVRFAGLIGYSRHPGRFFAERKIPQPEAPVNLIHRDDCISILRGIILHELWDEVFNACAVTHPSKRVFYSHARLKLGLAVPEFDESTESGYKIIDSTKIKQALNYRFKYDDMLKLDL